MSHTTEQAKALWCPMARLDGVNGSYNRETVYSHLYPFCISDECAMWRWMPNDGRTLDEIKAGQTQGYCGLAGRPTA